MRIASKLIDGFKAMLGIFLLLGITANFVNVVMRYVFSSSFAWIEEVLSFGLVAVVIGGFVIATALDVHLKIDIIFGFVGKRMRQALNIAGNVLLIAVCLYLAHQSLTVTKLMMRLGQKSVALRIPMWLPHGFIFLCLVLASLASVYAILRELRKDDDGGTAGPDALLGTRDEISGEGTGEGKGPA